MARPIDLTPEVQAHLCELVATGAYLEAACKVVGIGCSTVRRWRTRGAGLRAKEPFISFVAAIEKAEGEAEVMRLARLQEAAQGGRVISRKTTTRTLKNGDVIEVVEESFSSPQWQADAWVLERRHPDKWARSDRGQDNQDGAIEAGKAIAEALGSIRDRLQRQTVAGPSGGDGALEHPGGCDAVG